MSKLSSAGCELCEPSLLYNILTQCSKSPAVLDETYLALFDAREVSEYAEAHILLAKGVKKDDQGERKIPFGVHLPSLLHCVVYDGNTVSLVEETPAVEFANKVASSGSKNPVMVLKGGYERFSAEYPFLRTQKIMYTPIELQNLPRYPSEVLPLFLYVGERCHAYNAAMNYDLKIRAHISLGVELHSAYPGTIAELHYDVSDEPGQDLLSKFDEIFDFLEAHRKKSERVLVFSEYGRSRAVTVVMAYLIKANKWTLKDSYDHVRNCRHHMQPIQAFLEQLSKLEQKVHGLSLTPIADL